MVAKRPVEKCKPSAPVMVNSKRTSFEVFSFLSNIHMVRLLINIPIR